MILKNEQKRAAYAKNNPYDCSFEELVTILCTPDGKGSLYKLRCLEVLLGSESWIIEEQNKQIMNYLEEE